MPLLPGKKNVGHNIEVEQEHDKPHKQAVAIALSEARKTTDDKSEWDAMMVASKKLNEVKHQLIANLGVESKMGLTPDAVKAHPDFRAALQAYEVAAAKSKTASKLERRAKDDLQPVGAEDPERAIALKKHEEGITKSQDKTRAKDLNEFTVYKDTVIVKLPSGKHYVKPHDAPIKSGFINLGEAKRWVDEQVGVTDMKRVGDVVGHNCDCCGRGLSESAYTAPGSWSYKCPGCGFKYNHSSNKSPDEQMTAQGKDVMPVGDAEAVKCWECGERFPTDTTKYPTHQDRSGKKCSMSGKKVSAAEDELPVPIKPVGLVPGPSGEHNEETYAPRPVGDEHLGFKKLEGKLAHEKGVRDPAAVAAAIGREKYGAKGMAAKSAAAARDEVLPV